MGGRGAKSSNATQTKTAFINDLVKNYNDFTRGDLQGAVEAYAMQNNLDSDRLLEEIDKKAEQENTRLNNQARMNDIRNTEKVLAQAKAQETKAEKDYRKASGAVLMAQTDETRERERAKRDKAYDKWMKARINRGKLEIDLAKKVREYRGDTRTPFQRLRDERNLPF